jgi:hypothetical protein
VEHLKLKIMLGFLLSPPQPNKPENKLPQFSRLIFLERDALFNDCGGGKNIELLCFVAGEAPPLPSKSLSDFLSARNLEIPEQTTIYILAPENNSDKETWNYYGFWDNELKFVVGGSDSIQQNILKSGLNSH